MLNISDIIVWGGDKYMKGIVRWYNNLKGFGFILGENGEDVIIHRSNLPNGTDLYEGEKVIYRIVNTYRGPQVTNVKKA